MSAKRAYHQKLPAAGPEREALRVKGQFWTPDWVAEAMLAYVVNDESDHIFDPAVGEGAFLRAGKVVAAEANRKLKLLGTELDPEAIEKAKGNGLSEDDLANVQITDFVLNPPERSFKAIVCNPPYIRHHRLASDVKGALKRLGTRLIGKPLDGRAGLHVYFLLQALQLLAEDGRLAFIMPADTCEGVFSSSLWRWITGRYCLDAVVTFTPEASPFPGVDTNPIVLLIRNSQPKRKFLWARCLEAHALHLKRWTRSGLEVSGDSLSIYQRDLSEGLSTGLSRAPAVEDPDRLTLGTFATVMRGIATGANEFFFLTTERARELGIPDNFLLPAIGRTRDVTGDVIDVAAFKSLAKAGRPTLLFSPNGQPRDRFPRSMRKYLEHGESLGLHKRSLIATRNPWYKMEARPVPPFLFAYLGRRNARFIRNLAGVVPLTGFLCLYPRQEDADFINRLWMILKHPETIKNLSLVGKSYGGGAIKVEPRSLEKLPLPFQVVRESGISYRPTVAKRMTENQTVQGRLWVEDH